MAVESAADRAVYLNTDEFGVAATYTVSGGSATTINGIFDDGYEELGEEFGDLESSSPIFTCKTTDVSAVAHGDDLVIGSTSYKIVGVKPDNEGITVLELEEQ